MLTHRHTHERARTHMHARTQVSFCFQQCYTDRLQFQESNNAAYERRGKTSSHFRVGSMTMISGDRGRDVGRVRRGREVEERPERKWKGRFRRSKITATSSLHSWFLSAEGTWLKCIFKIHLTAGARMKGVFTVLQSKNIIFNSCTRRWKNIKSQRKKKVLWYNLQNSGLEHHLSFPNHF